MDLIYRSALNRGVAAAAQGEFAPLMIGALSVAPPIILAPMAGVTNPPYRSICREFGAGLCVSEMITARALVEGNAKTWVLAGFGADERPRSLQLYGSDPHYVGEAVRKLIDAGSIDHIDLNFGCPVPKVTRRGGGAAVPAKPRLLAAIVRAAVGAARVVPVTIKVRIGIDDAHENYLEAGRIAQEEGCQAIGLHARTATQFYGGEARWDAIARLKQSVARIRVLGNGDVFEAHDALRMMRTTNCDGVIVGRGCLGRPWLFRELAALFAGCEPENPPDLGGVIDVMRDHARRLAAWMGEMPGMCAFRKHSAWYTKAWPGSAALRQRLMSVKTLVELDMVLANVDRTRPYPPEAMRAARGKSGGGQRVVLPAGFWDAIDDDAPPEDCGDESTGEGG